MFSLIITIISIALVAALALATLYYGGDAFNKGQAAAQAAKLRAQGQQLLGAAELFYAQRHAWPTSVAQMVSAGYLSSTPLAQGAVSEALASAPWVMPAAGVPVFVMAGVDAEVCRTVNKGTYGLPGVLSELRTGYAHQCYGTAITQLKVVATRGTAELARAAQVGDGTIAEEDISAEPVPDAQDTPAWLVPPGSEGEPSGAPVEPESPPLTPAALSADLAVLAFAEQATNTSEALVVTIQNTGDESASFSGAPMVAGHPAYSVAETTCGAALAGGASCTVTVTYAPTQVGSGQNGTLTLTPAALDPFVVPLEGAAYNPVSLTATTLPEAKKAKAYGPIDFGSFLTISNEGSPDLGQVQWTLQGTLPQGLSFDTSTAQLSGTPAYTTASEGVDLSVVATYKNNEGQRTYTLKVGQDLLVASQVAIGDGHSCAVLASGGVKCWGANTFGQLGDGTTTTRSTPVAVVGLQAGVASVAVGYNYSCAVLTGGGLKCWGAGGAGNLGYGGTSPQYTPVDVSTFGSTRFASKVSAGNRSTCAVTTAATVFCWGENTSGQLGNGTTTTSLVPVAVTGLTSIADVAVGDSHACSRSTGGAVRCWGSSNRGQLGNGTSGSYSSTSVAVTGMTSGISQLATQADSTCALSSTGGVRCWGLGTVGQLGNGANATSTTPVQVSGLTAGVASLGVARIHACAVMTSGAAKCWGAGTNGQLGTQALNSSSAPVDVASLTGISRIGGGSGYTCAQFSTGNVKCWGTQSRGVLGDYNYVNNTNTLTPVDVLE